MLQPGSSSEPSRLYIPFLYFINTIWVVFSLQVRFKLPFTKHCVTYFFRSVPKYLLNQTVSPCSKDTCCLEKGSPVWLQKVLLCFCLWAAWFSPAMLTNRMVSQPGMSTAACQGFSSAPARENLIRKDICTCSDVQISSGYLVSNSKLIYRVSGWKVNMELERQECWRRQILQKVEEKKTPSRSPSNCATRPDLVKSDPPYLLLVLLCSFSLLTRTRHE